MVNYLSGPVSEPFKAKFTDNNGEEKELWQQESSCIMSIVKYVKMSVRSNKVRFKYQSP